MLRNLYYTSFKTLNISLFIIASFFLFCSTTAKVDAFDYWGKIPGPNTNDVNLLSYDDEDVLYAAVWGGGLYRSEDNAQTFEQVNDGLTNFYITSIVYDSSGNMLVGTYGGGVYRSGDGGFTWTEFNDNLGNLKVKALAVNANNDYFAGTYGGGVYRYLDSVGEWERVVYRLPFHDITALTVAPDSTILAGTNGKGIYKSGNNGGRWSSSNAGLEGKTISGFIQYSSEIYCATLGGDVHLSVNNGADWKIFDTNSVFIDPESNLRYNVTANVTSMVFNDDDELVVGTMSTGIWYHSDVDDAWDITNGPFKGINSLAINSDGLILAAVPQRGIISSTDGGKKWDSPLAFNNYEGIVLMFPYEDGLLLAGIEDTDGELTRLFKTEDNGMTWDQVSGGSQWNDIKIYDICIDSTRNMFAATSKGIWLSGDMGDSWAATGLTSRTIEGVASSPEGDIYVTTHDYGEESVTGYVYKSTNTGQNWTQVYSAADIVFQQIAVNMNNDVYGITNGTDILKSSDKGNSWNSIVLSSGLASSVDFNSQGHVYLSASDGVKWSTDNGSTWTTDNINMTNAYADKIVITPDDNLYVVRGGSFKGALYSADGGDNWDTLSTGVLKDSYRSMAKSIDGRVYLGTKVIYHAVDEPAMITPEHVSPVNNYPSAELNPVLTWRKTERADLYELQLSRSSDFSSKVENVVIADTSWQIEEKLSTSESYFWRLRSKTNASYSDWSQGWRFYTHIEAPELAYPVNELGGYNTSLTFTWHPVEEADVYDFQLSTNINFDTLVADAKDIQDTSYIVENLDYFTVYYWRVKAKNDKSESPWSTVWYFKTIFDAPVLREPPDSSINQPTELTMRWDTTDGPNKYEIRIATDPDYNNIVYEGETDSINHHTITLLEHYTTYYWKIRGVLSNLQGAWTPTWQYTTVIKPALLNSPADSTFDMPFEVMFEWHQYDEAEFYHLQVSSNPDFEGELFYDKDSLTTLKDTIAGLKSCETYYWRVRYIKGKHIGLWSEVREFSTTMPSAEQLYPDNDAVDVDLTTFVIWEKIDCAEFYEVQVAADEEFTENLYKKDSIDNDRLRMEGHLEKNTKYYWRVRGKNQYGIGDWSETWNFTTKDLESVFEYANGKNSIAASPNPFSSETSIEYYLSHPAKIKIDIIDINGSIVKTLFHGVKGQGRNEISWHPDSSGQGIYYCRFESEGDVEIIKLIYMR